MHFLTLQFPDRDLEKNFIEDYFSGSLNRLRYSVILGFLLYAIFGILDGWIIPEVKHQAWIIRYAIVCPYLFFFWLFTFSPYFRNVMQLSLSLAILIPGLGLILMISIAGSLGGYLYYSGLILVIMFAYMMISLRFIYALYVSWTLVVIYTAVTIWKVNPPFYILLNNNFFFISANIVGMFAGYSLEQYLRRNFLQTRIIRDSLNKLGNEISERRTVETELKTYRDHLEELVGERTKELSVLNNQLRQSQKMEAVGLLAGGIAHDFSNILTTIKGAMYLIRKNLDRESPLVKYAEQVLSSVNKANNLSQSLLTFSRKQTIALRPADLNEIIRKTAGLISQLIGEHIELTMILTDGNPTVMADINQIDQVLVNLAANARDAMPDGGTLTLQTGLIEMDEEFIRDHGYGAFGKYALLTVSDTGTGVEEEIKGKIFEPFFTTKVLGKGSGLGLAVTYGIVKQHGGFIDLESGPRKGTTFRIYIPQADIKAEHAKNRDLPSATGGRETILLAEDDNDTRKIMSEVLRESGYAVLEAADGDAAVSVFKEHAARIDLVLLDVRMPKKNAREVYDEIRRVDLNIKFLFMSGYTEDIIDSQGITEEGLNFISKAALMEEILMKIREILESKRPG